MSAEGPASEASAHPASDRAQLGLLLALAGVHALSFRGSGPVDDEMIFWRYARNWVSGEGLAFNPGQVVEGFSAPGWLLYLAAGMRLSLPPEGFGFFGSLVGVLAAVLGVHLAWRAARPESRWSVPALLTAASPALAWHAAAGLGTAPLAGLIALWLGLWLRAARGGRVPVAAALALGLAGLVRVEALAFAPPFLWAAGAGWSPAERWRARGLLALVSTGPALAWLAFRLHTFDRWLPVTYHVKRLPLLDELRFGASYLALSTATTGIGILALAAVALLVRRADRSGGATGSLDRPLKAATAGLLIHLVYVVRVGGDFMELARFFVPTLPVALLLGSLGFRRLTPSRTAHWLAFAVLAGVGQVPQFRERPALAARHAQFEERWSRIGEQLRRRSAPGTSVALAPIGAFGWHSRLELVDLLGLTNDELWRVEPDLDIVVKGHHRYDAEWTLDQRPDLIILANAWMPKGAIRAPG